MRRLLRRILLFLFALSPASADHYSTLGVSRSASTEEIRRAYKQMARKYHPDKCSQEEAEDCQKQFIAVSEAHEVLSDDTKRRDYDDGDSGGHTQQHQHHYGDGGGVQCVWRNGQRFCFRTPRYNWGQRHQHEFKLDFGNSAMTILPFAMMMMMAMVMTLLMQDDNAEEGEQGEQHEQQQQRQQQQRWQHGEFQGGYPRDERPQPGERRHQEKEGSSGPCDGVARRSAPSLVRLRPEVVSSCRGKHLALICADSGQWETNGRSEVWDWFDSAAVRMRSDPVSFAWMDIRDERFSIWTETIQRLLRDTSGPSNPFAHGPALIVFRANNSARGVVRSSQDLCDEDQGGGETRLHSLFDRLAGGELPFLHFSSGLPGLPAKVKVA